MEYNVHQHMGTTNQQINDNDFAVARVLNTVALSIIAVVRAAEEMDLPEDYEIEEINRAYVLLVHELEDLYEHNPKLAEAKPEPFWKRFDMLKSTAWQILNYLNDPANDKGQAHIRRLDRLCIIANNETPELSSAQIKLIENTLEAVKKYRLVLDRARLDNNAKIEDSWYIPKYWLDFKPDGSILINDVLKLKKTHVGSTIDQLLEQAFKNQNTLFTPKLPQTARNLSTVLSSAGFVPVLRQLFFPTVSKTKGVLFRSVVSSTQASKDRIDTTKLDLVLRALGADHTFSA
jgi:hypothetical protein